MEKGQIVEHKDKHSTSGYTHEGRYFYDQDCRMKDFITGNWVDAVIYRDVKTNQLFVREKNDFLLKFKPVL